MKRLYGLMGMAVLVAGCSSPAPAPAPAPAAPAAQPYATLAQVMRGIPFPNSNIIFDTQSLDPAALKDKKPGDTAGWRVGAVQQRLWRMAGGRERRAGASGDRQPHHDPRSPVREREAGSARRRGLQEGRSRSRRSREGRVQSCAVEESGRDARGRRHRDRCVRGVPRDLSRQAETTRIAARLRPPRPRSRPINGRPVQTAARPVLLGLRAARTASRCANRSTSGRCSRWRMSCPCACSPA